MASWSGDGSITSTNGKRQTSQNKGLKPSPLEGDPKVSGAPIKVNGAIRVGEQMLGRLDSVEAFLGGETQ